MKVVGYFFRMKGRGALFMGLVLGCSGAPVTERGTLVFVTWSGMLEERNAPLYEERRDGIAKLLAASDADVICLTHVYRREDHELLRARLSGRYPYVARVESDETTPEDDLDRAGAPPSTPVEGPCEEGRADFEAAYACALSKCAERPGDPESTMKPDCLGEACKAEIGTLLAMPRCRFCVRNLQAAYDAPLREFHDQCLRRGNPSFGLGWAFHGQNDLAIFSRRPLRDVALHLVGSTGIRAGVLHARIDEAHVFCSSLSRVYNTNTAPCVGPYCEGLELENGWARENLLQAEKVARWVDAVAGSEPTVLLGNFWASPATTSGDPSAAFPTWSFLATRFASGVASAFPATCDRCKDNPWIPATLPFWYSHVFLRGLPPDAVRASRRVFTERVVSGDHPPSSHYGLETTLAP